MVCLKISPHAKNKALRPKTVGCVPREGVYFQSRRDTSQESSSNCVTPIAPARFLSISCSRPTRSPVKCYQRDLASSTHPNHLLTWRYCCGLIAHSGTDEARTAKRPHRTYSRKQ